MQMASFRFGYAIGTINLFPLENYLLSYTHRHTHRQPIAVGVVCLDNNAPMLNRFRDACIASLRRIWFSQVPDSINSRAFCSFQSISMSALIRVFSCFYWMNVFRSATKIKFIHFFYPGRTYWVFVLDILLLHLSPVQQRSSAMMTVFFFGSVVGVLPAQADGVTL